MKPWKKLTITLSFIFFTLLLVTFDTVASDKTYVISYSPGSHFQSLVLSRTRVVYERAGIKAEFIPLPHKRSLFSANEGTIDGEVGRVPSVLEKYPNLRRVNVKLMDLNGTVYTNRDEIETYSEDILKKYRVGYVLGVLWAEKKSKGLDATAAQTYSVLFELLLQDRVDIILATEASADVIIMDLGVRASKARKLQPFVFSLPIHHYVNKKNEAIIPRLEKALKSLIQKGYWDN